MKNIKYDIVNKELYYDYVLNNETIQLEEDKFNPTFFDKLEFQEYHQKNCKEVYRVINFKKEKIVSIYYMGIKNNEIYIPYSSPFSQLLLLNELSYNEILSIVEGIDEICKDLKLKSVNISLPPFIYSKEIEKQFLMLLNYGFNLNFVDINHYFDLNEFVSTEDFVSKLSHAQRKNYNRCIKEGLNLLKINNDKFEEAFKVIEINRAEKGYPLRMTKEQVKDILQFKQLSVDFFIVENMDKNKIAAAMVYKVNSTTCQVIYWGHIDEYSHQRPMSLLSVGLCEYYKDKGISYLDIGPSSENGNISLGLAQFKSNMGCKETSKFSLKLERIKSLEVNI